MAVATLTGKPTSAIRPRAQTTLTRLVTIGTTTPWTDRDKSRRRTATTASAIGIRPTRSRCMNSPNVTLVIGPPI